MSRRNLALAAALLLLACRLHAATWFTAPEQQENCGDPLRESFLGKGLEGTAGLVLSPRSFLLHTADGRTVEVTLAHVGEPFHPAAREILTNMLRDTTVTVVVPLSDEDADGVTGEVYLPWSPNVSQVLLRAGLVTYAAEKDYAGSQSVDCESRIAEREARAQGVGIWSPFAMTR